MSAIQYSAELHAGERRFWEDWLVLMNYQHVILHSLVSPGENFGRLCVEKACDSGEDDLRVRIHAKSEEARDSIWQCTRLGIELDGDTVYMACT